jgi:group I intron endonuclease
MSKEETMYYIYCYTNKINNHKYVGQTSYPARRKSEHKYAAFTSTSDEYNFLFHKKLREYGEENFSFEILEEIDTNDLELVDIRESYWIEKMSSHVKTGKGYNLTLGGQSLGRHKEITEEKVRLVVKLLGENQLTQKAIAE